MIVSTVVSNVPGLEPVDVTTLKRHLDIPESDRTEDANLETMIVNNRARLEGYLNRVIAQKTFVTTAKGMAWKIPLKETVLEVEKVEVFDREGNPTVLLEEEYTVIEDILLLNDVSDYKTAVTYTSGMLKNTGEMRAIEGALLSMCVTTYKGETEDPLTEGVKGMVGPYRLVNV